MSCEVNRTQLLTYISRVSDRLYSRLHIISLQSCRRVRVFVIFSYRCLLVHVLSSPQFSTVSYLCMSYVVHSRSLYCLHTLVSPSVVSPYIAVSRFTVRVDLSILFLVSKDVVSCLSRHFSSQSSLMSCVFVRTLLSYLSRLRVSLHPPQ